MTEEAPAPQTPCIVTDCSRSAVVYVAVGDGANVDGESAVPMCDAHAAHWRAG